MQERINKRINHVDFYEALLNAQDILLSENFDFDFDDFLTELQK